MGNEEERPGAGWIKGGGAVISDGDFLLELKLGAGDEFSRSLLFRKIAVAVAVRQGIAISADELDDAMSAFYSERDLFEQPQIAAWLNTLKIGEDEVREHVRETALANRARELLITDDAVRDRFGSERYEYSRAEADVFGFATGGEAREFMLAVREKEKRPEGGERRQLARREAAEEIAAILFSAEPGELIGPVETEDGTHEVYVLISRDEAVLDDDLREKIRSEMFIQLLETELARDPVAFLK